MKTSLSERTARFLTACRWPLLVVGIVSCAWFFVPARSLDFDRSIENMFAPNDPLLPPYRRLKRTFGGNEVVLAVYADPELLSDDGNAIRRLGESSGQLKDTPGVRDVLSLAEVDAALRKMAPAAAGLLGLARRPAERITDRDNAMARRFLELFEGYTHGRDAQTAAVICMLEPASNSEVPHRETVDQLREKIERLADGQITGEPAMVVDGFRYIEQDANRLGWATTLLLSVTIIICFRSVRWVLIAIGVVQLALLSTRAILVWSGLQLSMVSSMLTAVVTVVGVATVVHIIVRFREARVAGASPRDALVRTIVLLSVPVFWACTTDAVGFSSLMVAGVGPVQDFGLMMATGCLMVLVCVALLIPGLSLMGWHPTRPQKIWGETLLDKELSLSLNWVSRRPKTIGMLALVFFAATAAGVYRLEVETDFTKNFRAGSPIVRAYETAETKLGGAGVWDVIVPAPEILDFEYLERIQRLQGRLRNEITAIGEDESAQSPLRVLSLADAISAGAPRLERTRNTFKRVIALRGAITLMHTHLPVFAGALHGEDPDTPGRFYYRIMLRAAERQPSEQKQRLIEEVTRISREEFDDSEVTGFFVLLTNLIDSVIRDQWLAFAVALTGIGVTMLLAFRDTVYALIALVPNALPILTVTGLMGWLGLKINMGAAMIAAVSVGLSVDSSIHYICFFRRARAAGKTVPEALTEVQQSVGRAMVFSTLALVVGFSVLCISEFVPTIYFGFLVTLSMLGGLVGNLVILPLLLRLAPRRLSSMEGRYNRAKFLWVMLAIAVVCQIISVGIGMVVGALGGEPEAAILIALIVGIGIVVTSAFQMVKRLHDLDRPGTHFWLMLLPIYNIYLGLLLLFKKGTEGENRYGPDPLSDNSA